MLPKSGSVRFSPKICEPRVELKVRSRKQGELRTGPPVQVQERPVQVQCQFEPEPNIFILEMYVKRLQFVELQSFYVHRALFTTKDFFTLPRVSPSFYYQIGNISPIAEVGPKSIYGHIPILHHASARAFPA